MKTLRFTVLILSLANCFASKSFASEPSSDQPARRTLAADGNLDHALCPVTGDPVAPEFSVALEGGKVYFSSGEALREYRGNRNDFDELARAQLVVTGQAEQIRCPVSRQELSRPVVLRIEGVDVGFASAKAQQTIADLGEVEQRARVFGTAGFRAAFRIVTKERTTRRTTARNQARGNPRDDQRRPALAGRMTAQESDQALQRLANAMQAQDRNFDKLSRIEQISGSAVSFDDNGKPVILVLLETAAAIKSVPAQLDGIPVVTEVVGAFYAGGHSGSDISARSTTTPAPTGRHERPVPIGISGGVTHPTGSCVSGTIGCRLKGTLDGAPALFALSNNHVLADINRAPLESTILQPGIADTSCAAGGDNAIGVLERYQVIQFLGLENRVDAAIATVSDSTLSNSTPASDGYGTPTVTTRAAVPGLWVQKYGRSTRRTTGTISGVNSTVYVKYATGTAMFTGQILVTPRAPSKVFARSGDSGSLLVSDPDKAPVGLIFSANSAGTMVLCNPIDEVLGAFESYGISIDGVE